MDTEHQVCSWCGDPLDPPLETLSTFTFDSLACQEWWQFTRGLREYATHTMPRPARRSDSDGAG